MRCTRSAAFVFAFVLTAVTSAAQDARPANPRSEPSPQDKAKLVKVNRIFVAGTRIPSLSVIRVMGIKSGDAVNDEIVNKACHRLQSTGLIKSVDYQYLVYPDKPGVQLTLTVADEEPLVPASIQPKGDADALWSALKELDPLFTQQLPPDEKA